MNNTVHPYYLNSLPKRSEHPKIHRNFIFRFGFCCLSEHEAAQSVCVDINQIYRWDDGEPIPFSVKRVWMLESGRKLPKMTGFEGWSFKGGRIVTPDGAAFTERQLKTALFLLGNY